MKENYFDKFLIGEVRIFPMESKHTHSLVKKIPSVVVSKENHADSFFGI